jgi:hypothetical protein
MEYKASLDPLAKGITIGGAALLLAIGQENVRALLAASGDVQTIVLHSGPLLLFIAVLLGNWLYAPQSYTLDRSGLTINRPIGKVSIRHEDIKHVRLLAANETRGTLRTFGLGGFFGYFGKFYIPGIGHSTFYATQWRNKILITTCNNKKIVISPDDSSIVDKLALS